MSDPTPTFDRIETLAIEDEVRNSYLTYASSVIQARALPDVCDGLKPSQRRILLAMHDLNLAPRAKFRKCAKIAGDTSGNYHPHGESVVYPTLVRMAQWWNMRYPLVMPQGNFGNIDGDPPAAMRYTEAKMTAIAVELLDDLEYDTVLTGRNYDDTRSEPSIFPGKFPNLICNGSSGIAVGMATSMPPHNLREVCGALNLLLDREQDYLGGEAGAEVSVAELMEHIPAPDFPTGALICGRAGVKQAYETGRGRLVLRAKVHREEKKGRESIVIDEIPYHLQMSSLVKDIADLTNSGRVEGISDVNDETGRECKPPQVRIVVKLKRDANYEIVLNNLFKHSQMQKTFGINLMAVYRPDRLAPDRQPETLPLRALLRHYIDHRFDVITRRTEFLLARAEAKAHILEGLIKATQADVLDQVISVIRSSQDRKIAEGRLVAGEAAGVVFSQIQAEHILNMTLARLTGLEREKLQTDYDRLLVEITDYRDILARRERVYGIIKEDLQLIDEKYGDDRRSEITASVDDFEDEDLIADEQVVVTLTSRGYAKRTSLASYKVQKRGGKGVTGAAMMDDDYIERLFVTNIKDYILFFTNLGQLYWLKIYRMPEGGRTAKGRQLRNLIQLREGEEVQSVIPVTEFTDDRFLVFVTRNGQIKKTPLSAYSNVRTVGVRAIKLDEEDQLVRVRVCGPEDQLLIGTQMGMSIRFPNSEVRSMGRVAGGVRGIRLDRGDHVIDMALVDEEMSLLTVSENGYGKRSQFQAYRLQGRGGRGVINLKTSAKTGMVVAVRAISEGDQLLMITANGQVVRTSTDQLRIIGRATQGVRLINVADDDRFASVARLPGGMLEDEAEDDAEGVDAEGVSEGASESAADAAEDDSTPTEDVE